MSLCTLLALAALTAPPEGTGKPFVVHVIDQDTRRGVPLVELKTTGNVVYPAFYVIPCLAFAVWAPWDEPAW